MPSTSQSPDDIDIQTLTYRPCVGVMLFNDKGEIFTGRRLFKGRESADDGFSWQMPQGGIDANEEPIEAAKRELFEETNIQSVHYVAHSLSWLYYDLPEDTIRHHWKGLYKGQMQKWVLFHFIGKEDEINVTNPANGQFQPEFDIWAWRKAEDLPALIIPFKRKVYENIIKEFTPQIQAFLS